MSLWALLAAPLLAGNDVRQMSEATRVVLLNREVIAVDQDKLGQQARRVSQDGATEAWARPLAGGAWAVGLFNRGAEPAKVTLKLSEIGVTGKVKVRAGSSCCGSRSRAPLEAGPPYSHIAYAVKVVYWLG